MTFKNRRDAGQQLAKNLKNFENKKNTIILALPRGGVVLGYEIAKKLKLPLDLVVPRKIGAQGHEEYAIGAITEKGQTIFNQEAIDSLGIKQEYLDKAAAVEKKEAQRRLKTYRQNRPPLDLANKTIIIVDDGIATGLTMEAAIKSVKAQNPAKIIIAVPVAAKDSLNKIEKEVDKVICLYTPLFFGAVGSFYQSFAQTQDEQVIDLMKKSKKFGQ